MTKRAWAVWAMVVGFALGGFYDGILLHQILQWHHLLSLVPEIGSLRLQVVWDGYFHALMYVLAAVGLWGLWRVRASLVERGGGAAVGAILIGFGLWHVIDSVLSHWVLGIHRIKLDSPDPLMWDLIWFFGFGLAPIVLGYILLRPRGSRPPLQRAGAAVLGLAVLTAGAGLWALQSPRDQGDFTTVVFRPGAGPDAAFRAAAATDARLVWASPDMAVVVLKLDPARRWSLYRHQAMLVSGSGVPAGCFDWSRA